MYTPRYKAASSAHNPRKQATTANMQVQKLQTLKIFFVPYAFVGRFSVLGIFPHPVLILFCPAIFRVVAWVRVCIVSGMLLCASSPRDMGDTTIVGYLVRLCHHV